LAQHLPEAARAEDGQLRFFGLCSIVIGLLLLWVSL
jgi:uncharacterized protein YjeT (DUF2065 family)